MQCDGVDTPALIADLGVRGAWPPWTEILFDVHVTDVDALLISIVLLLMYKLLQTELLLKRVMFPFHLLLRQLMVQWGMRLFCS